MPFDRHDLLRQTDYEEGDFVPMATFGTQQDRQLSFTQTSYNWDGKFADQFQAVIRPNDIIPAGVEIFLLWAGFVAPGTDETIDIQLTERTAGTLENQIREIPGITSSTSYSEGPFQWTPSDRTSTLNVNVVPKTDPGANSSRTDQPQVYMGVEL